MFVDVHAHLFNEAFDEDRRAVIQRAGCHRIINNGLDYQTNQSCLTLQSRYHRCGAAAGLYPGRLSCIDKGEEHKIYEQMRDDRFVAVGEVGLDYSYAENDGEKERQRSVFRETVRIAVDERKPVIIHSRNAESDVLEILEETMPYAAVLHSFTGRRHQWRRACNLGYYFSIPPVITRATHFQQLVRDIPFHQLLTESDAPYLGAIKGERSEPRQVAQTTEVIGDVKEERGVAGQIERNHARIF